MHTMKDGASVREYLNATSDPELKRLLAERVQALSEYDDYDLGELAHFYVVETPEELQSLYSLRDKKYEKVFFDCNCHIGFSGLQCNDARSSS